MSIVSHPFGAKSSLEKYPTLYSSNSSLLVVELKVSHPQYQSSQKYIPGGILHGKLL